MPTLRTAEGSEGRLFPSIDWNHGWRLSLQADAYGYQCAPQQHLDELEAYQDVEAIIYGPFPHGVDPAAMGLPPAVLAKFTVLDEAGVSVGCHLTWEDVAAVKDAIVSTILNPNAGIPRGIYSWPGRSVFHGTSREAVADIEMHGINVERSAGGYFGQGFYVADDMALARSNYADFSEDEGAVIEFVIGDGARIIDMRNSEDWDFWRQSGIEKHLGQSDLAARAVAAGIDGVFDRSVGGFAIFNPKVLGSPVAVHGLDDEPDPVVAAP